MTGRKYDDKMNLDMPFAEALERFVGVDPREMHANIAKAKKAKPPGGRKAPPPVVDDPKVAKLRDARMKRRNAR
jgi:hypothetical protein